LIDALSEIIWQAGETRHRHAIVAMFVFSNYSFFQTLIQNIILYSYKPFAKTNANISASALSRDKYVQDGITENMELFEFVDSKSLKKFISYSIDTVRIFSF
jgi:hypothetical protein